jgi:hypothetical protein
MAFNEKIHPYKILERRSKSDLDRSIEELERNNGWTLVYRDEYKKGKTTIYRAKFDMRTGHLNGRNG